MKVGDLKAALESLDNELVVVVNGYEGGYADPKLRHTTAKIYRRRQTPWYEGKHGEEGETPVLVIGR